MATIQGDSQQVRFQKLLQEAANLQLTDLEQFIKQLQHLAKRKKTPRLSKKEEELIEKIKNGGPDEEFWKKYDSLLAKLEEEVMTEKESLEFESLIEITSKWTYDRLKLMIELAEIWDTSVDDVLQRLKIKPRERVYA